MEAGLCGINLVEIIHASRKSRASSKMQQNSVNHHQIVIFHNIQLYNKWWLPQGCVISLVVFFSLVIRHADYICLTVLHGVFSNGSSNCQPKRMYNCMSHWFHLFNFSPLSILKCFLILTFFHYAFLNVSSNCLPEKMHSHTGCMCLTFLHCAF